MPFGNQLDEVGHGCTCYDRVREGCGHVNWVVEQIHENGDFEDASREPSDIAHHYSECEQKVDEGCVDSKWKDVVVLAGLLEALKHIRAMSIGTANRHIFYKIYLHYGVNQYEAYFGNWGNWLHC